jgi:hypothetical protein
VKTTNQKNQITRRGFLELGSAALATAGFLPDVNAAQVAVEPEEKVNTATRDSAPTTGKIALEEHLKLIALPEI